ncbi:hypothetical protein [Singulisphaera sp. PoT]|uniref:hypothetical protein n=1 Tax=Singulisphaera sp. PoT TaxID=3411797 RepID=UPI003BF5E512
MNWSHMKTFIWLRWRLAANQWRRYGKLNAILMSIIIVAILVVTIPMFIGSLVLGIYVIPKAQPEHLMYAWDAIVVAFLFFWLLGLLTELQRTESLSLSKFMHLPVTVTGAYIINYVSSLVRLSLIFFGPIMLGYCLALVITKGFVMVLAPLLTAAFLLMITALTYQFQGWLASLMSNPRRRRSVVVGITMSFVVLANLPNLINFSGAWKQPIQKGQTQYQVEMEKLNAELAAQKLDVQEHSRRVNELNEKRNREFIESYQKLNQKVDRIATIANTALPIGWLPLGVRAASEGRPLPALLGLFGMTLIGGVSLWRAYNTTVGIYQGRFTNDGGRGEPEPVAIVETPGVERKPGMLEVRLPIVSEPVSVIAAATLKSLIRSPEAKMMLLSPIIMCVVFGSMLVKVGSSFSTDMRPLIAIATMASVLFGVMQQMGNLFGFDRDGFRVFVLCAARRRDILLGKNLAFAPIALGLSFILLIVLQVVYPMSIDRFLGMIPQFVTMYLIACLLTNVLSIYTPLHIALGSMKPAKVKLTTVLIQVLTGLVVFPIAQAVTIFPYGLEFLAKTLGWTSHFPVFLILAVLECAFVIFLYDVLLNWEGEMLQSREQKILEVVTSRD